MARINFIVTFDIWVRVLGSEERSGSQVTNSYYSPITSSLLPIRLEKKNKIRGRSVGRFSENGNSRQPEKVDGWRSAPDPDA